MDKPKKEVQSKEKISIFGPLKESPESKNKFDFSKISYIGASLVGVLGGMFFLSPNITGGAVADLNGMTSNVFGMILLAIGLTIGFFSIVKKKAEIPA